MAMSKLFRFGLLLTSVSIALNAMGYHALQHRLEIKPLAMFETASRYSVWGGMWFMILGLALTHISLSKKGLLFIQLGLLLFCGSLFLYVFWPFKPLMILTPLGGLCMIVGFAWCGLQKTSE